jgi:hypothetical protein
LRNLAFLPTPIALKNLSLSLAIASNNTLGSIELAAVNVLFPITPSTSHLTPQLLIAV